MRTAIAIATTALLCPLIVAAQGTWTRQPTEVMGVRLGAPLESAGIQPCAASSAEPGRLSTSTLCYRPLATPDRPARREQTFYAVHNAPDLGASDQRVFLDVAYGRVVGILLTGASTGFDKAVTVLEARYGPAMETTRATSYGPTASTKVWRGDKVTLEAISPFGRADEYAVYWTDLAAQAQKEGQIARESARIASKL